ncbi:hypothetical protein K8T06_02615 [bacterium]|nr:hypothetical protein [bacterium]
MKRKCYIIAGPNGSGKTTFATEFLPVEAECLNFINADLIAQGGHNVPEQDIRRRFTRSWLNFNEIFKPLADSWIIFDTSVSPPKILVEGNNI